MGILRNLAQISLTMRTLTVAALSLLAFVGVSNGLKNDPEDNRIAKAVDARSQGVGRIVPDLVLTDLQGDRVQLRDFAGSITVIALTSTTCPICMKYGPSLARIEDQFQDQGVRFVYLNPSESDELADMAKDVSRLGLDGPYVADHKAAKILGAKSTAEVFVIDKSRTLIYRGAVDDQYGIGTSLDKPRNKYLIDALESALKHEEPAVRATSAPGCLLNEGADKEPPQAVTFHNRVSRILQDNCIDCHRKGGIAPFSLETYEQVKDKASMIDYVIEKGIMPPWFAADTPGAGPWKNDRSIPARDKEALQEWLKGPMPAGSPKDAPQPKKYSGAWKIGEPDAIYQIGKPIAVKAEGVMPYQTVIVPTSLTEETWVQKLEVQPTAKQVVHHVLIFIREPGRGSAGEALEEVSGFFAAYVPGNNSLIYPDGFAKRIPAGASLKFQIHYTPNGRATEDQTRLGVVFAKKLPKHEVKTVGIVNLGLAIPPGADNHKVSATVPIQFDIKLMSMMPHMHVRGKACRYDLTTPEGKRKTLLDIPRYDFNWQLSYDYREPIDVLKGSKLDFSAWYDNSEKNPHNPDPTKLVRWGLQTYDEMHLGYIEYYVPGQPIDKEAPSLRGVSLGNLGSRLNIDIEAVFKRFDKDGDGKLTRSELTLPGMFDRLDTNGDGFVTIEEARSVLGG